jgi:hypothetical protein
MNGDAAQFDAKTGFVDVTAGLAAARGKIK